MAQQYIKNPVVIEAIRVKDALQMAEENWSGLPSWLTDAYEVKTPGEGIVFERGQISINTLEGTMIANKGDWIIRGVKGEIYPCKHDIFKESYSPYP